MKTVIPALAVSALLLVGCGTDDTGVDNDAGSLPGSTSTGAVSPSASPTASAPPTDATATASSDPVDEESPAAEGSLPDGLLPMDDPGYSDVGETVTFDNGTDVTVEDDAVEVSVDGTRSRVALPNEAEGGVARFPVEFAQAGTGYLVEQSGGEFSDLSLVIVPDGKAVLVDEPEDVPFGFQGDEVNGVLAQTWTTDGGRGGLFTRTRVGEGESLSDDTYRVYSWEVVVRADGGADLVPADLGIACFDDDAGTYEAC